MHVCHTAVWLHRFLLLLLRLVVLSCTGQPYLDSWPVRSAFWMYRQRCHSRKADNKSRRPVSWPGYGISAGPPARCTIAPS